MADDGALLPDPLQTEGSWIDGIAGAGVRRAEELERAAGELSAALALNDRVHARARAELDRDRDGKVDEVRAGHAARVAEIERKVIDGESRVDRDRDEKLRKARREADEADDAADASYKDAVIMSEGLFESRKAEFVRARDDRLRALGEREQAVRRLLEEAEGYVRSYRQAWRSIAAAPSGPADDASLEAGIGTLRERIEQLRRCRVAAAFRGPILAVPAILLAGLGAAAGAYLLPGALGSSRGTAALAGLAAALVAFAAAVAFMWSIARRQVKEAQDAIRATASVLLGGLASARAATGPEFKRLTSEAEAQHEREVSRARLALDGRQAKIKARLRDLEREIPRLAGNDRAKHERFRYNALEAADRELAECLEAVERWHREACDAEVARHAATAADLRDRHAAEVREAVSRWHDAQARFDREEAVIRGLAGDSPQSFGAIDWPTWFPPRSTPPAVRIGTLRLRLDAFPCAVPDDPSLAWTSRDPGVPLDVPALAGGPGRLSVRIEAPPADRPAGLAVMTSLVARILVAFPPGQARFTFIDPIGLGQSFAGFMHLADEMDQLVGERAWTDPRHIEQRLAEVTEHMETVIQKYLRNEFASLAEYNVQAGEMAEPYRFVVFADFPASVSDASARRLTSILRNGPRCGVHVILLSNPSEPMPAGIDRLDLEGTTAPVRRAADGPGWTLGTGRIAQVEFVPDPPPADSALQQLAKSVGRAARATKRVEVPFSAVAPRAEERWTLSSAASFRVALGRSGANRLQHMLLGEGTRQHALVAGKTGSGKSSLLNALIVNTALWYSPDEVELWLIDFKKGVEFKAYASGGLPHARAVAVESDREFGLSVLQGLDAELTRRGEVFRTEGVQNVTDWRSVPGRARMPRVLLIIDEFQELFTEDDKVAQDASLLLDRLVRQGRAFGMHVILGSQTLGGAYGIARATMGQMGVRIALQCNETDSQLILSDDNTAARLLSRPGEAIYNDAGGLVEGNNPFQVVWIGDAERDVLIREVRGLSERFPAPGRPPAIVFEGNRPADPTSNALLAQVVATSPTQASGLAPRLWLGDAVSIKDPTSVRLARRTGANVAMVGQRDESAAALLAMAMISISAQVPADGARMVVLDGTTPDDRLHGMLALVAARLPVTAAFPSLRDAGEAVVELAREVARRAEEGVADRPGAFLLVNGLHRYRSLRRDESDFGYGSGGDATTPDKALALILREGPSVGVHCVLWCDTAANLQRSVDRASMRDIDSKVLFQMSANDSSSLIDGPAASRLGFHRALLADEESGLVEKFRPYSFPDAAFVERIADAIGRRPAGARP